MAEFAFSPWQRRLLIVAPPVVLVLFVIVLLLSIGNRRESTARVQHTYAVIGMLRQLRTRLVDAETGQRGFVVTGDSTYLGPYRNASAEVTALLDSVGTALGHDAGQAAGIRQLQQLVSSRLAVLELPIRKRAESFEAAREQLIAGRGREAMAALRDRLTDLEAAERRRLDRELAAQSSAEVLVLGVVLSGALLVLAVALLTRRRFARYERELENTNTALSDLNARLQEQAVELELQAEELQAQATHLEESTAELQATNDELHRQHRQLEDMATELELANEELLAANALAADRTAQAEAANRVKTEFLASMSHELRTPLNAIAGYVDLLDFNVQGPLTEAQRSSLQRIRLNGRHLLVLINDILEYAKIQAGKVELRREDVALDHLIGETAELVQPLLQSRGISFHAEPRAAVPVRGDRDRIRQILLNLLTNAAKYSNPGGSVLVISEADGDRVCIRVRDSGWGIPPEMQQAIFDPFVQLNRGAGGNLGDGVGLGLSISRQLAIAMDGDLSVESTPGQGSTFTLTLPFAVRVLA